MKLKPNCVFKADCLALLERIPSESVQLVYVDPPWGTHSDPFDGRAISETDYREFLAKIVRQALRILNPSGTLFFHSTPSLNLDIRLIIDQIFGRSNYRAEYIFPYKKHSNRGPLPVHSTIYLYSKTDDFVYNPQYKPSLLEKYPFSDNHGLYRLTDMTTSVNRPSLVYEWNGFLPSGNRSWKFTKEKMAVLESEGKIEHKENSFPKLKIYQNDDGKQEVGTIWDDIESEKQVQAMGFGAQPIGLLSRVIKIGSNENDCIIDPFCGSGTSFIAAHSLNRFWVGCDSDSGAIEVTEKRLKEMSLISGKDYNVGTDLDLEKNAIVNNHYFPVSYEQGLRSFEQHLIQLIQKGEDDCLEFKEGALLNRHSGTNDPTMIENIFKALAGFMNSSQEGKLIIGVKDRNSEIIGVEDEYKLANSRKRNQDGYLLFLNAKLNSKLKSEGVINFKIKCYSLNRSEVCVIDVKPAKKPVYVDGVLYVRSNGETRKLSTEDAIKYYLERFI